MHRHESSKYGQHVNDIELATYEFRFQYEMIACIYCKQSMTDYYDLDRWPYGYPDFEDRFGQIANEMVEIAGVPESSSHLRLRGSICDRQSSLHICALCGWWVAVDSAVLPAVGSQFWLINLVSHAALVDFDLANIDTPMSEVRRYLRRRYESRQSIHPRLFEQIVASVFKDLGYDAQATAYSNDGGIDVVLRSHSGERIGVQVKRRRRKIEVEQVRSFLGALVIGGFSRGVFVSTSTFQRGAILAADRCDLLQRPIELVDPNRFFELLGIAQQTSEPAPEACGFYKLSTPPVFLHSYYHLNSI